MLRITLRGTPHLLARGTPSLGIAIVLGVTFLYVIGPASIKAAFNDLFAKGNQRHRQR